MGYLVGHVYRTFNAFQSRERGTPLERTRIIAQDGLEANAVALGPIQWIKKDSGAVRLGP